MILVLEIDDGSLFLYPSLAEAESHLEAIDVENGEYEFCDDTGQRFVGEIVVPVTTFQPGNFRLRPDGTPERAVIASIVARAHCLAKGCGEVKNLDDLRVAV
jgi:hypothetical protein